MPIDPMTMMMAAALFAIEQQLGTIEEMGQQIISFLEIEKEAKIEADVKTLTNMITNYKHNWDNKLFVASNHKMVLDRSGKEFIMQSMHLDATERNKLEASFRDRFKDDPETWELGKQYYQNVMLYGTPNWYDWCWEHLVF